MYKFCGGLIYLRKVIFETVPWWITTASASCIVFFILPACLVFEPEKVLNFRPIKK